MSAYSGQIIVWVNITADNADEALDELKSEANKIAKLLGQDGFDIQDQVTADTVFLEEE